MKPWVLAFLLFSELAQATPVCRDVFDPGAQVLTSLTKLQSRIETLRAEDPHADELYSKFAETYEAALSLGLNPDLRVSGGGTKAQRSEHARRELRLKSAASRSAWILRHQERVEIYSSEFQAGTPVVAIRSPGQSFLFNTETFARERQTASELMALSSDRVWLASADSQARSLLLTDQSRSSSFEIPVAADSLLLGLRFSPDHRNLLAHEIGGLRVYDLETRAVRYEVSHLAGSDATPDGTKLVVAHDHLPFDGSRLVKVLDLKSGQLLFPLPTLPADRFRSVQVTRDGKRVVALNSKSEVVIFNLAARSSWRMKVGLKEASSADLTPDNRTLVVGAPSGLEIWDIGTRQLLASIPSRLGEVKVRFLSNATLLTVGERGLTVYETPAETSPGR